MALTARAADFAVNALNERNSEPAEPMSSETEVTEHGQPKPIDRREAIERVSALLGGVALVGGTNLITACEKAQAPAKAPAGQAQASATPFTNDEIALLDEIAETILPATKTPGAKAAKTGAFMALMVTDGYSARDQQIFREGMRSGRCRGAAGAQGRTSWVRRRSSGSPCSRVLDREQKRGRMRATRRRARRGDFRPWPDRRRRAPPARKATRICRTSGRRTPAVRTRTRRRRSRPTTPPHYFRMMKELALLGYFTSEIGCTQAQRYEESPGKLGAVHSVHARPASVGTARLIQQEQRK